MVSQKCQYALRAVFDVATHQARGPVKAVDIAARQAIPHRFLNLILNQLKHGGFVVSRRGSEGGFVLAKPAACITVGDIMRFVQGPLHPVDCLDATQRKRACPLEGNCVFSTVWQRAEQALSDVYDGVTVQALLEEDRRLSTQQTGNYSI